MKLQTRIIKHGYSQRDTTQTDDPLRHYVDKLVHKFDFHRRNGGHDREGRDHADLTLIRVLIPARSRIHARDGERHGIRSKRRFGDWRDPVRSILPPRGS